MRVLIVQQKMIGDVLTSTIICQNLKEFIPECTVHYMVHSNTIPVLINNPYIDKIIDFKPEYRENMASFYGFLKSLKKEPYDVVIDVYGKLETNLITHFCKAPIKIGYDKWYTRFFYTHPIKPFNESKFNLGKAIEKRLQLLQPIIKNKEITEFYNKPKIFLSDLEKKEALTFLKTSGIDPKKPIFMIGILGSGSKKTYPFEYMAQIIEEIVEKSDSTLLFNYIPSQINEVKEIYNLCSENAQKQIKFEAFASSLRGFLSILSHCKAIIGNEGGAINMAKALEIPTFSIFSPWIDKEGWALFEDQNNMSVHINDYKPELFKDKNIKSIKKSTDSLYNDFKPEYIKPKLNEFLKNIL